MFFQEPSFQETPHSGYHWRGQTTRFFEGWYFRLTLPQPQQTFAFMYSIDDPAGGGDHSGGVAQILGPDETYYCRTFPRVQSFWAWPHRLGLGHWRQGDRAQYLSPASFRQQVSEGYQATAWQHQGKLRSPSGEEVVCWDYQTQPIASWGAPTPQATAGWLSYFSVFEPGWQVLMAHGLATGYVTWHGQHYGFENAPAYAEKNWGGTFPAKWFWMQCNAFSDMSDLSVTAAGGVRGVLGWSENVGLIGIHYQGQFYDFLSTRTPVSWAVDPWGYWWMRAQNHRYEVTLTGVASDDGAWVRVPTRQGMQWLCRDTTHGQLTLTLRALDSDRPIVEAVSPLAGLEIGGGPWAERWVRN